MLINIKLLNNQRSFEIYKNLKKIDLDQIVFHCKLLILVVQYFSEFFVKDIDAGLSDLISTTKHLLRTNQNENVESLNLSVRFHTKLIKAFSKRIKDSGNF